ncbi:hypothetical protein BC830DRAFT_418771 [Chytriomyces sp. MP71]|nr:hypothetical protein BC830DRAFT_418771 [Chytriomyces sp. MP71]
MSAWRMSEGKGGASDGEQEPLGYGQQQQEFHVSPQARYMAISPPQQYHPAQMLQVHPDRIQHLQCQDATQSWNPAQQQQGYYEQQQQPYSAPILDAVPPVPVPELAAAPAAATVQAEPILGADAANLSAEDRAFVESFLSGQHDKTSGNKEIKLSESTVTDAGTGVTQVHTLYLVLDYEACKWKKIKRKRKI